MAIKPIDPKEKKELEEVSIGFNPDNIAIHPHGSSSATDGLEQFMAAIFGGKVRPKTVTSDSNIDNSEEINRKKLQIALVDNQAAVEPHTQLQLNEEGLEYKRRSHLAIYNAQTTKGGVLALKTVMVGWQLKDLEYLTEAQRESCVLLNLTEDPMVLTRLQMLEKTQGQPCYAFYNGQVYFITAGGQLSIARSADYYNTQFELSEQDPNTVINNPEESKKYLGKVTYMSYANQIYLIEDEAGALKAKLCQLPGNRTEAQIKEDKALLEKLFSGNGPQDVYAADMEKFESLIYPHNSKNTKSLHDLFQEASSIISKASSEVLKKIEQFTTFGEHCHKPHHDIFSSAYIEKMEFLGKLKKHILDEIKSWKKEERTAEKINKYLEQFADVYNFHNLDNLFSDDHRHVTTRNAEARISYIAFNSTLHKNFNSKHFGFEFKQPEIIEHVEKLYENYKTVMIKAAIEHLFKTRVFKGKTFGNYPNLDAILSETVTTPPPYSKEELETWGIDEQYWKSLLEPVTLSTRYEELLNIFNTELKNTNAGNLNVSNFRDFLKSTYSSDIFKTINGCLKTPFDNIDESIQTTLENSKTVADISRKLDSLTNMTLQKVTSFGIPKKNDATFCLIDSGFPPPKKADGTVYTAEELTELQILHMIAVIYKQHIASPNDMLEVGFNEIADQEEKLARVRKFVDSINKYVSYKKEAASSSSQEENVELSKEENEYQEIILANSISILDVLNTMSREQIRRTNLRDNNLRTDFARLYAAAPETKTDAYGYEVKAESKTVNTFPSTVKTKAEPSQSVSPSLDLSFFDFLSTEDLESKAESKDEALPHAALHKLSIDTSEKPEPVESVINDESPRVTFHAKPLSPFSLGSSKHSIFGGNPVGENLSTAPTSEPNPETQGIEPKSTEGSSLNPY